MFNKVIDVKIWIKLRIIPVINVVIWGTKYSFVNDSSMKLLVEIYFFVKFLFQRFYINKKISLQENILWVYVLFLPNHKMWIIKIIIMYITLFFIDYFYF